MVWTFFNYLADCALLSATIIYFSLFSENNVDISDPLEEEREEDPLDVTSSGRKKRNAAKRASKKMSAVIGEKCALKKYD